MSPSSSSPAEYAIGVDVGGTKINAAIVSRQGEVKASFSLPTLAGRAPIFDRIASAVESVMAGSGVRLDIAGIGIGTAGQVDRATGSIRFASDLIPGYTGLPLKRLTEERFGLPVCVDNDVNVLALTESLLGSGRRAGHMVCVALGTGIGGAIIADGKLLHGAWGGAGELGHMSVDFRGIPCICGGSGCLEQYASGTGIAQRMREKLAELGASPEAPIDTREVVARWLMGDPVASVVMDDAFAALGAALASLIHTFNPELVVIGGGVADIGEPFFNRVREETYKRGMRSFTDDVRIVPSHRGNWSAAIGAALQVWQNELHAEDTTMA